MYARARNPNARTSKPHIPPFAGQLVVVWFVAERVLHSTAVKDSPLALDPLARLLDRHLAARPDGDGEERAILKHFDVQVSANNQHLNVHQCAPFSENKTGTVKQQ